MQKKIVVVVLASAAVALSLASVAWACAPPSYGGSPSYLTVDPTGGPAGTRATVTGQSYRPRSPVDIFFSSPSGERTLLATPETDAEGRFSITVTIPDVPPGSYAVVGEQASAPFEVMPSESEPPPGPWEAGAPADTSEPAPADTAEPAPADTAEPAPSPSPVGAFSPRDTAPPRVSARPLAGQRFATVLRRGLVLRVGCSEACRIQGRVAMDADTTRRLRFRGIVARRSTSLSESGSTKLVMRPSARARRALRRAPTARLKVVLTVIDTAGNKTAVRRTIRLKR